MAMYGGYEFTENGNEEKAKEKLKKEIHKAIDKLCEIDQFWRRVSSSGIKYFVLTAGMFVVGIVIPEIGIRANLAAEIKEIAGRLYRQPLRQHC